MRIILALTFLLSTCSYGAMSRPDDRWAQATPERQEFFKKAMRPDYLPRQYPCCGDADAYEADEFTTDQDGNLYAILTCNDPDTCVPTREDLYLPPGKKILIPPEKVLPYQQPPNKTGHGIVFVAGNGRDIFCYAPPGGY